MDCTLVLTETQFEGDLPEEHRWECEMDSDLNDEQLRGHYLDLNLGLDEEATLQNMSHIQSGKTKLHASHALIEKSKAILHDKTMIEQDTSREATRKLSVTGRREVLVVRVEANDTSTSVSESELAKQTFGIGDPNGNNLKKGYAQCSYNQLQIEPSPRAFNGIHTVTLNESVYGQSMLDVKNSVLDQLRIDFSTLDLNSVFDHVMICLPHGTKSNSGSTNWAASAAVNGYVSFFNDSWCTSFSAQMHEIGHNLGLRHSNEGNDNYEDKSGFMGHSFNHPNLPNMCFNTAKNYELGWYADKSTIAKPLENNWNGQLVGYVDYHHPSTPSTASIVTKIEGGEFDYFIGFNRKAGINSGNQEEDAADKVLVHIVGGNGESSLLAKLGSGESYDISEFGDVSETIVVKADVIDMSSNPAIATVSVTKKEQTNFNEGILKMTLKTDRYPSETSWRIVDNCNDDKVVMEGGNYGSKHHIYEQSETVRNSQFTLQISDTYGDGLCCGQGEGFFSVTFDGVEYASGGEFAKSESLTWGDCNIGPIHHDTPSPTKAPTLPPTSSPSASPTSCDITYQVFLQTPKSNGSETSWSFASDLEPTLILRSNVESYQSDSLYIEQGCLPSNCYNFKIHNAAVYGLKINDVSIIQSSDFVDQQMTLFGTCQDIAM